MHAQLTLVEWTEWLARTWTVLKRPRIVVSLSLMAGLYLAALIAIVWPFYEKIGLQSVLRLRLLYENRPEPLYN